MKTITEKEFLQIANYVKSNYGVNLLHKKTLVIGRLQNYLTQNNFNSFSQYYEYVLADKTGKAASILLNKLTTNHTFFMREVEHFNYFKSVVLPYLADTEKGKKDLRIWSAGCSSGEEPYTLAMIIADYFGPDKGLWDTHILATDISTNALDSAVKGVYSNEDIAPVQERWKREYFKRYDENNSIVTDKIKNEIIFRTFNLMNSTFPFKRKFHVIFCRNVMIYFDDKTKAELVNKFFEHTERGGYLFIGHSESLNRETTRYKYVMPAVYRKE